MVAHLPVLGYLSAHDIEQLSAGSFKKHQQDFYIPIVRLPGKLRNAVGSAYLCFRAIDEIEDHPHLPADEKIRLLNGIAELLREPGENAKGAMKTLFAPSRKALPKVTLNICSYAAMAPRLFGR